MGLTEREQQLLDEMERRLYQSEADVMQASGSRAPLNLRSLVFGILLVLVGIGLLLTGVALPQLWLGVLGFAVMLGGALLAFSKRGDGEAHGQASTPGSPKATASRESLTDRLERRWDQRMEGER